jgi:anti-sigma factor RsiW
MNDDEIDELIGMAIDNELPDALKKRAEALIAADPALAADAASLRATVQLLRSVPLERPDPWFVDRALRGLLRENEKAQDKPLRFA